MLAICFLLFYFSCELSTNKVSLDLCVISFIKLEGKHLKSNLDSKWRRGANMQRWKVTWYITSSTVLEYALEVFSSFHCYFIAFYIITSTYIALLRHYS